MRLFSWSHRKTWARSTGVRMSTIVTPIYEVSTWKEAIFSGLLQQKTYHSSKWAICMQQCSGSALVLMRIRIQPFTSMRIRSKGVKPMRIHADPYPVSWSTSDKFLAPGPGFLKRIQIRIQETKSMRIHADTDPQHWYVGMLSRYIPQSIYFFF
jgi:hypothetical protein